MNRPRTPHPLCGKMNEKLKSLIREFEKNDIGHACPDQNTILIMSPLLPSELHKLVTESIPKGIRVLFTGSVIKIHI